MLIVSSSIGILTLITVEGSAELGKNVLAIPALLITLKLIFEMISPVSPMISTNEPILSTGTLASEFGYFQD